MNTPRLSSVRLSRSDAAFLARLRVELRSLRKDIGASLSDVARGMNCRVATLAAFERGHALPTPAMLARWLRRLVCLGLIFDKRLCALIVARYQKISDRRRAVRPGIQSSEMQSHKSPPNKK